MDFFNSAFGQNTQKTLGDYARFAKNLQNGGGVTGTDNSGQTGDIQNQMMLMMMMLLMSQITGQPPSADLLGQLPPPFVPGISGTPPQNPAVKALETRFSLKVNPQDPTATPITFTEQDVAAVKADLKNGLFTRDELGEALMHELAKGADKFQPAVQKLIQDLSDSGELNPTAFLKADYLKQLPAPRQDILLSALSGAGLILQNNKPNIRLIGFVLEALGQPDSNESKTFVQKLLQKIQTDLGTSTDSARRKIVSQLLELANISVDGQGKLTFT
jgi:polyhydroxyalkanoate synthesis regulator phasin